MRGVKEAQVEDIRHAEGLPSSHGREMIVASHMQRLISGDLTKRFSGVPWRRSAAQPRQGNNESME